MKPVFACELRDSFCQRQMDSYLFVFSFGQSKGKADKFQRNSQYVRRATRICNPRVGWVQVVIGRFWQPFGS